MKSCQVGGQRRAVSTRTLASPKASSDTMPSAGPTPQSTKFFRTKMTGARLAHWVDGLPSYSPLWTLRQ